MRSLLTPFIKIMEEKSSGSVVKDLENELRQVQGNILLLEYSIHNLQKKNCELKKLCENQTAEIRVLKLQTLKGKLFDEIETCSGMSTIAKLNKTYETVDLYRKKNLEEIEKLKEKLETLEEEELLVSAEHLKSQMDLDTLKRERDDILRDCLIEKNRNNALRIRNEKTMKEISTKKDELLKILSRSKV